MPQAYKVVGRAHRRMTTISQQAIASDGSRIEVKQNGPMVSYAVGDVIEDIRADELLAFPDRFVPATSAEVDEWHRRQSELPTIMRAPGLSAEQAVEHADLTRQIEELQAKQQALLAEARTPVPTPLPAALSESPPGRRSENLTPGSGLADAPGHMSAQPPSATTTSTEGPPPEPESGPAAGRRR
jgi:hypothetical protein